MRVGTPIYVVEFSFLFKFKVLLWLKTAAYRDKSLFSGNLRSYKQAIEVI